MNDDFRAFWSVVPATVLDDMSIPANAKILYGVLSSLMRREGYCRPTNAQLAAAMHCSEDVISRWIAALGKAGHIRVMIEPNRKTGGKIRRIYPALPEPTLAENAEGYSDECPSTYSDKNPRVVGQKSDSLYIDGYIKKKKEKEKPTADAVASSLLAECEQYGHEVALAMRRFLSMRAEIKKPVKSAQAATMLMNKLRRFSDCRASHMVALLDKATECQWTSLYQLKSDELMRLNGGYAPDDGGTVDLSGLRFV